MEKFNRERERERLLGILDLSEFGFRLRPPIDRCGGDGRAERKDGGGAVQCDGIDCKTGVLRGIYRMQGPVDKMDHDNMSMLKMNAMMYILGVQHVGIF